MKKRLLFMMASLVLCGAVNAQEWGTPESHAQSSNTPIVAQVLVEGNTPTDLSTLTLGAFVGNDLRGRATVHTDDLFWIQVFYTDAAETISFKLYDSTGDGTEYTTCSVTETASEEGYGTPSAPQVLNFTTTQTMTQTTAFPEGWSWWSSYIELGDDALTTLENGLGDYGNQILSRNDGYANRQEYMGYVYWDGTLSSISNEQMYMIQTNAAFNMDYSGPRASVANHPITINKNWNWIGFPSSQSMSVADALQGFTPESGDQLKGRSGYATYSTYESIGWWDVSNGFLLEPGQGYMYKSNSDNPKTLIYQTTSKTDSPTAIITNYNNVFKPQRETYAYNMTVTAVVELNGEELRSEDHEIAAYVGDQCRGTIRLSYVEPLDRYEAFLLIFGEAEETIRFMLTDGTQVSCSDDHILFGKNDIIGTTTEPVVLHFGPLDVENNSQTIVNVYPNPSKNVFNIEGKDIQKIEVIDYYGQIILSKETRNDFVQISLSDKANGAFLLRVITSNGIYTNKIIKK